MRNDSEDDANGLVLAAVGNNFESALAAVMYHSRNVVFSAKTANHSLDNELQTLKDDVKIEWRENWYDGLGYCESSSPPWCMVLAHYAQAPGMRLVKI